MTKKDIEEIILTSYIKPTGDDWWDMIAGTFFGLGIYGSIAVITVMKLGAERPFNWITLLVVLAIIIYSYWADGKIELIKNELTRDENLNLLISVFKKLDWPIKEYSNQIEIKDDKCILKFIHATIIFTDNCVGFSFQYTGTYKSGRPAFFIGIRTYLKRKFKKELNRQMNKR